MENGLINMVIETPRDSDLKYSYEEKSDVFRVRKILPMGTSFPLDFGFIPNTKGDDGDPLDVLILSDRPGIQGSVTAGRLVGMLCAEQHERDGKVVRNDRFLAVARFSWLFANIDDIAAVDQQILKQLERFFVLYNDFAGKRFVPLGWKTAAEGLLAIGSKITAS